MDCSTHRCRDRADLRGRSRHLPCSAASRAGYVTVKLFAFRIPLRLRRLNGAYRIRSGKRAFKSLIQLVVHFLVGLLRLFRIGSVLVLRRWIEFVCHDDLPMGPKAQRPLEPGVPGGWNSLCAPRHREAALIVTSSNVSGVLGGGRQSIEGHSNTIVLAPDDHTSAPNKMGSNRQRELIRNA
jgi:hypothetical protein